MLKINNKQFRVISNGYHEDFNQGVDKEMFKWLSDNPEYKAMLSELLAFADTGMKDFQLEKRNDGLEVKSLHAIYDNFSLLESLIVKILWQNIYSEHGKSFGRVGFTDNPCSFPWIRDQFQSWQPKSQ